MRSKSRHLHRRLVSPANAEPTHFIKIMLPRTIHAHNMAIPKEFVRRFENELCTSEATIGVSDGCVWKMELTKSENEVWFGKGWEEFVKYYSLCFGFFLVFKYEGKSQFSVVIFDPSAAEIHCPFKVNTEKQNVAPKHGRKRPSSFGHGGYNTSSQRQKVVEEEEEIIDIDDDDDALSHGKSGEKNGAVQEIDNLRKLEKDRFGQGRCSKMKKRALGKKQTAIKAAQNFKPKEPFFTAVIKPPNLIPHYMDVPAAISRPYMGKTDSVKLQNCEGKRWVVNCSNRSTGSGVRMWGGWIAFARANNVKEGDVCVFELIKKKDIVFKGKLTPGIGHFRVLYDVAIKNVKIISDKMHVLCMKMGWRYIWCGDA